MSSSKREVRDETDAVCDSCWRCIYVERAAWLERIAAQGVAIRGRAGAVSLASGRGQRGPGGRALVAQLSRPGTEFAHREGRAGQPRSEDRRVQIAGGEGGARGGAVRPRAVGRDERIA